MTINNILLIAEGQVGDLLLLTPAIRTIKENHPNAHITLLVINRREYQKSNKLLSHNDIFSDAEPAVLSNCTYLDKIFTVNHGKLKNLGFFRRIREELKILRFLRTQRFDVSVVCLPKGRFVFWALYSHAGIRIGEATQKYSNLLTHKPLIDKEMVGVRDYYLGLISQFCENKPTTYKTEYCINSDAEKEIELIMKEKGIALEKPSIAIHPGATGNYKIYPPSQIAEVMDYLSQSGKYNIILCGGLMDRPVKELILKSCKRKPHDIETSSIQLLGALFSHCILTITNDSGPRHLSVAVGTPNFAVFRKHHDRAWKVYPESVQTTTLQSSTPCPVCSEDACNDLIPTGKQFGSYCIRQISVNEISLSIMKQLNALQKSSIGLG